MRIIYWLGGVGDKLGGLERYNILLAEICFQRGYELVIMHDKPNTVPEYVQGLQSFRAKYILIGDTYSDPLHGFINAANFIRSWKPDIVHTHFVNPFALPILKILGVPLVYQTYHTGIDHTISLRTRLLRKMVQFCTKKILAVSERIRRDGIMTGINPDHIQTLPLGLSIQSFLNSADIHEKPTPFGFFDDTNKIVITVGRFFPEKGMRFVVEAAIEILKQRQGIIWWLVGKDGPDKDYCYSQVQNANLGNRILFLGQRNDVSALMKKAYIQVVGSLFEGLGLMALESSAFGVPVVGTNIGGLDEAVINGVTGILVPRNSSHALAEATIKLLDDKQLHDQMGQSAKLHVNSNYNAKILTSRLLDIYQKDYSQLNKYTS